MMIKWTLPLGSAIWRNFLKSLLFMFPRGWSFRKFWHSARILWASIPLDLLMVSTISSVTTTLPALLPISCNSAPGASAQFKLVSMRILDVNLGRYTEYTDKTLYSVKSQLLMREIRVLYLPFKIELWRTVNNCSCLSNLTCHVTCAFFDSSLYSIPW